MQQTVGSKTTNSSAQAIVPKDVPRFNTFEDLSNNIVYEISLTTSKMVIANQEGK